MTGDGAPEEPPQGGGERGRVGLVGLGLMGERMLGAIEHHGRFRAVAGFDPDRDRTLDLARAHRFEPMEDEASLLARDDLDVVYIASPPAHHVPTARAAIAGGHALLVEKPLAVSVAEAEELVTEIENADHPAAMHFPFATMPGLPTILRELTDGTAGDPLRIEVRLSFSAWPRTWHTAGPWLSGPGEGGFLREVFSHFAFLSRRVVGPLAVERVHGERDPRTGVERRVVAELRAGPIPLVLTGAVGGAAPDFCSWTLFAERRSYRLTDWRVFGVSDGRGWESPPQEPGESSGIGPQLDGLAAMLAGRPHPLATLREGLEVARAVESLLAAIPDDEEGEGR